MLFKQYRINKLKVKIAKYQALSDSSVTYTRGETNGYFINCHQSNIATLAESRAKLAILEAK